MLAHLQQRQRVAVPAAQGPRRRCCNGCAGLGSGAAPASSAAGGRAPAALCPQQNSRPVRMPQVCSAPAATSVQFRGGSCTPSQYSYSGVPNSGVACCSCRAAAGVQAASASASASQHCSRGCDSALQGGAAGREVRAVRQAGRGCRLQGRVAWGVGLLDCRMAGFELARRRLPRASAPGIRAVPRTQPLRTPAAGRPARMPRHRAPGHIRGCTTSPLPSSLEKDILLLL